MHRVQLTGGLKCKHTLGVYSLMSPASTALWHIGDATAVALLERLLRAGCAPYFAALERWLCEGVLDDPFAEFMVQEDPARPRINAQRQKRIHVWAK